MKGGVRRGYSLKSGAKRVVLEMKCLQPSPHVALFVSNFVLTYKVDARHLRQIALHDTVSTPSPSKT
jgi:hypothetical protein